MRYGDLPAEAIRWARIGILDTVAVTLAGANEDCVRILERIEGVGGPPGPSLVFWRPPRAARGGGGGGGGGPPSPPRGVGGEGNPPPPRGLISPPKKRAPGAPE